MNSYKDKATLEELHTRRGMTLAAMGAMFGVSNVTIRRQMIRLGVSVLTSNGDAMKGRKHSDETKARMAEKRRRMAGGWSLDKETLEGLYLAQGLSTNKIASIVGCNVQTVVNWLERYGIPKRPRGACIKGERNPMHGKPRSEETKAKLRVAQRGRYVGSKNGRWGKPPKPGRGAWYTRRDGSRVWLRSSYEIRVACLLDARGVEWLYECRRFTLDDRTYCPDFYLPSSGEFWEVKGWLDPRSAETIAQFRRAYPTVKLKLIFKGEIEAMEGAAV